MNFTMSNHAPIAGYVSTSSDSAGDTTWSNIGGVAGVSDGQLQALMSTKQTTGTWALAQHLITTSALTVMNGNVGIGTWVPSSALQVNGDILLSNVIRWTNTSNIDFSGNSGY